MRRDVDKCVNKVIICVLAAVVGFTGMNLNVSAAGISSVLPNCGVNTNIVKGTTLETLQVQTGDTSVRIESILKQVDLEEERKAADRAARLEAEEALKNLVIAQTSSYVNVRNMPDENAEILGKLYHNSVGKLIGGSDGWYQIKSGTVTGYVKAEYCVTGEAAVELAKTVCKRFATVDTETLKVRTEPSMEAAVLTLVPHKEELVVSEEVEGWVKVSTGAGQGWVSSDYVILSRQFVEAESKAEEEVRLKKEAEERRKAREAAAKAAGNRKKEVKYAVYNADSYEMGRAVADYALQFVGNPYVYGGTSLTNGADCSGFVMSVYAEFGISLPRTSADDRKVGTAVDGLSNAQPGDLVCYSGHVAMYIGDGQIVHAANSRKGIIVSRADYDTILTIRRIF